MSIIGDLETLSAELWGEGWKQGSEVCDAAAYEIENLRRIETAAQVVVDGCKHAFGGDIPPALGDMEKLIEALRKGRPDKAACPDCGDTGIVYTMLDETEISQPPGSSGRPCPTCVSQSYDIPLEGHCGQS